MIGIQVTPWGKTAAKYIDNTDAISNDHSFWREYWFISTQMWDTLGVGGMIDLAKKYGEIP